METEKENDDMASPRLIPWGRGGLCLGIFFFFNLKVINSCVDELKKKTALKKKIAIFW